MRGNTVFRSCQKLIGKLIYYRLGTFAVIRSWPFPRRPTWWAPTTAPAPPLETPPVTTTSTPTPLPASSCPSPPPTPPATSSTPPTLTMALAQPPATITLPLAASTSPPRHLSLPGSFPSSLDFTPSPWGEVLEEEQEIFVRQTECNNNNIYKGGPVDDNEVEDIEVFPCEQCDYKSKKRSNLNKFIDFIMNV